MSHDLAYISSITTKKIRCMETNTMLLVVFLLILLWHLCAISKTAATAFKRHGERVDVYLEGKCDI